MSASRLQSFEDMPEEEYGPAFAELTKLCDIYAKKTERFDSKTRDYVAAYRMEGCDQAVQPPSRYIRKAKSKKSQSDREDLA